MENKHTITLRYIREKLYYVNVPDILWDYLVEKNCNRSEILVYMYYLREWSKKQRSNIASISSETLAEKLGISPKSVKNANKKLESLELIERRQETRFSQIDLRYSSTAITTPKIPDELTKRIEIQGQRMRNYHDPVLGEIISIDDLNEKLNKFEADQIRNLRTNAQRIKDIIYHYLINSPNSVDNHFPESVTSLANIPVKPTSAPTRGDNWGEILTLRSGSKEREQPMVRDWLINNQHAVFRQ